MKKLDSYSVLMPLAPWEPQEQVARALASLEIQTLPPSQVVVSCDGSPPVQLLHLLQEKSLPLELVIGPGGEGVGPVLARGLVHCRHELVVRADADDISQPERCAVQVAWMQKNPKVSVLGTIITEFLDHPEQPISQRWVPIDRIAIARTAYIRNPLNHPSVILRRSSVMAVGNYRSVPCFEDYDLWLRLLAAQGPDVLANLNESLVLARVGVAHLQRRQGLNYALAEARFFYRCGRQELLPWWCVVSVLLLRFPLRLLPSSLLAFVMRFATRKAWTGRNRGTS
jgi:hypothetical protein